MSLATRRAFLQQAAAAGAAFAVPHLVPRTAFGANDQIHIAVAGIHGRGQSHIDGYSKLPGCRVTHLVDPDSRLFAERANIVEKKFGARPKCVQDLRKALDDKDLDAVSIASCNHWHSLLTIWACQAGKDVYVEKPCSHNVYEGRKCVEAARKYARIVQHGTQSRSSAVIANTVAAIASGKYGKLLVAKGYCCKPRWSIGFKETQEPPPELDFDLWLGPAPKQPYHENLVHYNWHWFWDTGNGDMGNQGVHQMDIARWGIPGATLPKSVVSLGGRWVNEPNYQDQGQTPNMLLSVYDFGQTLLVFETRGLVARAKGKKGSPAKDPFPQKVANEWYLEAGKILNDKFYPKGKDKPEPIAAHAKRGRSSDHFGNFLECVRSRRREDQYAEILEGHYSAALCHLGNISYRLGHAAPLGEKPRDFPENEHVAASLQAIRENLVGQLGMDLGKTVCQVGPKLEFDARTEKFVHHAAADALLTRPPRPPYVVPEKV
jgi:predicted dehydrogenase